jgi:hypothetical protein
MVLRACRDAGLNVRLRDNYVNLYFRGRSLGRMSGRRRLPAKLAIHHKYVAANRIGNRVGWRSGAYCAFDVDTSFARIYATQLDHIIERAHAYVGPEESVESRLLEHNDGTATVCCFDRQIQVPGSRRTLDLIGYFAGRVPALVATEVKRYPDPRIQDVSQQLHDYLEIFDPNREGLRADVAWSYRTVCRQLGTLGLPVPDPARIQTVMPVKGLVVASDYNPRSRLLSRAHELSAARSRPLHLWQPPKGEYLIPAPERWVRMGSQ